MALNIVKTEEATPTRIASVIVRENEIAWWVKCESGRCDNVITVGKREYRPVDYNDPEGPHIQTNQTAPGARTCALCGPMPR